VALIILRAVDLAAVLLDGLFEHPAKHYSIVFQQLTLWAFIWLRSGIAC
jgi:hypothetical protein